MDYIKKAIDDNRQKSEYLDSYLTINEMVMERLSESNISAARELMNKKRAIITGIHVIDDKIIRDVEQIKLSCDVEDLSELDANEFPELRELKDLAMKVLRKMVDVKKSDEAVSDKIDAVFEDYKNEKGKFDKGKLQVFTKKFFDPE
ncbi:MAG: hypothetical protein Q4A72_02595 [Bacillota bacterium]|nr:hypothetical protein [Bacillota bacterium]